MRDESTDEVRVVLEVRKDGPRVRIIVSRTHPDLVRRLFELEAMLNLHLTIEEEALAALSPPEPAA